VEIRVKWITGFDQGCHQSDTAGGIATTVLEMAHLLGEGRLPGTVGGLKDGEYMVQNVDHDLDPLRFGAPQFLHLKAQVRPLSVVGLLQEFSETAGFGGHGFGDALCRDRGLGGLFLVSLPLGGRAGDLGGDLVDVLQLACGFRQQAGLGKRLFAAVAPYKGKDKAPGRPTHTNNYQ
jgi:hypothetical protein